MTGGRALVGIVGAEAPTPARRYGGRNPRLLKRRGTGGWDRLVKWVAQRVGEGGEWRWQTDFGLDKAVTSPVGFFV
jgi:hypothetical protein